MPRHETLAPMVIPDVDADPLAVLGLRAAKVLSRHTDQAGWCPICGSAWPCQRARLAEHNLAGL